jgi:hypothetical protein
MLARNLAGNRQAANASLDSRSALGHVGGPVVTSLHLMR